MNRITEGFKHKLKNFRPWSFCFNVWVFRGTHLK